MDDLAGLPARHKLDTDVYHRMVEAGVFDQQDRIELIEGELIDMAPIGQGHAAVVGGLAHALFMACGNRAIVWPQNPVQIDRSSAPQPDLAVLRPRPDFYATGDRPGPADILLLVEVADTSLQFDRTVKLPIYAQNGVAEYWIVDLKRRVIGVYRGPRGRDYAVMTTHHAGETLALAAAPEIMVTLNVVFA